MKSFYTTVILLLTISTVISLEHGEQEEGLIFPEISQNQDVIVLDLSNIDHANGAEIPKNMTEEDTKIIPTNIDFAALKEVYAKENKAERFLPSRLIFDDKR